MRHLLILSTFIWVLSCETDSHSNLNGDTEDNERLTNLSRQRSNFIRDFYVHNPEKKLYSAKNGAVTHIKVAPGIYKITEVFEDQRNGMWGPSKGANDRATHNVASEELYLTSLPDLSTLDSRQEVDRASRLYSYLKTVSRTKTFGSLSYGTYGNRNLGQSWQTIFNQAIDKNRFQHVSHVKYPSVRLGPNLIDDSKRSSFETLLKRFVELKKIGVKYSPLTIQLTDQLSNALCDIALDPVGKQLFITFSREATYLSEERFNSVIDHILDYSEDASAVGDFTKACRNLPFRPAIRLREGQGGGVRG